MLTAHVGGWAIQLKVIVTLFMVEINTRDYNVEAEFRGPGFCITIKKGHRGFPTLAFDHHLC
jgi:hypothetical protein